jgi:RimJ/RimL family protein N-acetyltransferase
MTILHTRRLTLRPPRQTDVPALVSGLGNFNVSRWTGRIPHPYGPADAEAFLGHAETAPDDALILLIARGDEPIGGIGVEQGELGYWLAEPHWGQGYGREAARAVVDHAFTISGVERLVASYQLGNVASRRILLGLGFVETKEGTSYSRARQAEVPIVRLELIRIGWEQAKHRRP